MFLSSRNQIPFLTRFWTHFFGIILGGFREVLGPIGLHFGHPGPSGAAPGGLPGALGASEGLQTSILVNFEQIWTHFGGPGLHFGTILEALGSMLEAPSSILEPQVLDF